MLNHFHLLVVRRFIMYAEFRIKLIPNAIIGVDKKLTSSTI
jgi:hypothetical protein